MLNPHGPHQPPVADICDNCLGIDPTWYIRDTRLDPDGSETIADYWFCSADCALAFIKATS